MLFLTISSINEHYVVITLKNERMLVGQILQIFAKVVEIKKFMHFYKPHFPKDSESAHKNVKSSILSFTEYKSITLNDYQNGNYWIFLHNLPNIA